MAFMDDLKRLNPKEPGGWPWPIKGAALAVLLLVIIAAGAFLDWKEQWDQLGVAQEEEIKLKDTFTKKKADAINLEVYRQQLKDVELTLGALLKELPNKSEMEALLTDINRAGLGRGLQFELFKPAANETMTELYAELPINLRVTGNYHDFGAFASEVSQLQYIVTLNDINVITTKDGLAMDAVAKTFRYLDEEEVAKQKKAAAKPK